MNAHLTSSRAGVLGSHGGMSAYAASVGVEVLGVLR